MARAKAGVIARSGTVPRAAMARAVAPAAKVDRGGMARAPVRVVIAAIVLSAVAATVPTVVMNRAASHRLRCRIST